MRSPRALLISAAGALLGLVAAGCANASPASHGASLWYTCCSTDVSTTVWHPGQQLRLDWSATGGQAIVGQKVVAPVTLTAVLTGPYPTIGNLKKLNAGRPDPANIAATAPVIKLSAVPSSSPVSVLTIPPGTRPGSYNLSFSVASGGSSVSGGTVITVA